jgi:hypothetical protein
VALTISSRFSLKTMTQSSTVCAVASLETTLARPACPHRCQVFVSKCQISEIAQARRIRKAPDREDVGALLECRDGLSAEEPVPIAGRDGYRR